MGNEKLMPTPNERLKRERELRGWSQSFLAGQIGVPDTSLVSKWERGIVQPSPHYREKLCSMFGKTAQELGFLPAAEEEAAAVSSPAPEGKTGRMDGQVQGASPHTATTRPLPDEATPWATSAPLPTPTAFPERAKARRRWPMLVLGLLLVLVALSSGVLLAISQSTRHRQQVGLPVIGSLYFASSGQVNDSTSQGIADEALLDVHSLAPLPTGQGYYAWLLPDQANPEQPVVSLGQLTVRHGSARLMYSDPSHTNLLAATSQLLITAQPVTVPAPSFPPVESSAWRYIASIPQVRAPGQEYSLLDHLRHLLSDDPELKKRNLRGGLTLWLYRNMQDVLEWSISAQRRWHPDGTANTEAIRAQVVRVLNYLDGTSIPREGAPRVPVLVDPRKGSVALLEFDPQQSPPGYLAHIPLHIRGVIASPGASQSQRLQADQLLSAIDRVKGWLNAVYGDAVQLAVMSAAQLQGQKAQGLLDDMETNASSAFAGQTDPVTGELSGGGQWLYQHMPELATMQVTPYQPS
jgi:transcriptional regulator with XRE-family HTH domain